MENGETPIQTETADNNPSGNGVESRNGLPPGIERAKTAGRRGRPPGSKNKGTPLDTGATVPARPVSTANINPDESAAFIGKGFVALIELGETLIHNASATRIEKKYPSKLAEFKEMAQSVSLTPKDAEVMKDCSEAIAKKYDVLTRFGPEVVLGVFLAQYSMRQITLLRFVEKVTTEKKAEKPE